MSCVHVWISMRLVFRSGWQRPMALLALSLATPPRCIPAEEKVPEEEGAAEFRLDLSWPAAWANGTLVQRIKTIRCSAMKINLVLGSLTSIFRSAMNPPGLLLVLNGFHATSRAPQRHCPTRHSWYEPAQPHPRAGQRELFHGDRIRGAWRGLTAICSAFVMRWKRCDQ